MTKTQLLARLVITYLLMCVVFAVLNNVLIPVHQLLKAPSDQSWPLTAAVIAALVIIPSAMVYLLLFQLRPRIDALFGLDGKGDPVAQKWIVGGHRILMVYIGLMQVHPIVKYLIQLAAFLAKGPRTLVDMIIYRYVDPMFQLNCYTVMTVLVDTVRFALAIYLLLGAPSLVSWLCTCYQRDLAAQTRHTPDFS